MTFWNHYDLILQVATVLTYLCDSDRRNKGCRYEKPKKVSNSTYYAKQSCHLQHSTWMHFKYRIFNHIVQIYNKNYKTYAFNHLCIKKSFLFPWNKNSRKIQVGQLQSKHDQPILPETYFKRKRIRSLRIKNIFFLSTIKKYFNNSRIRWTLIK